MAATSDFLNQVADALESELRARMPPAVRVDRFTFQPGQPFIRMMWGTARMTGGFAACGVICREQIQVWFLSAWPMMTLALVDYADPRSFEKVAAVVWEALGTARGRLRRLKAADAVAPSLNSNVGSERS